MKIKFIVSTILICILSSCATDKLVKSTKGIQLEDVSDSYIIPAKLGNPVSQYNLGYMYYTGKGVSHQDYGKALYWYLKAANQGIVAAQSELGYMYYSGLGTSINVPVSMKWYQMAASSGDNVAEYNLAVINEFGMMSRVDYDKSIFWFKRSSNNGNIYSKRMLANRYLVGRNGAHVNYTKARLLLNELGSQKNSDDIFNLGVLYYSGYGVKEDLHKAYGLFYAASKKGNKLAKVALSLFDFSSITHKYKSDKIIHDLLIKSTDKYFILYDGTHNLLWHNQNQSN